MQRKSQNAFTKYRLQGVVIQVLHLYFSPEDDENDEEEHCHDNQNQNCCQDQDLGQGGCIPVSQTEKDRLALAYGISMTVVLQQFHCCWGRSGVPSDRTRSSRARRPAEFLASQRTADREVKFWRLSTLCTCTGNTHRQFLNASAGPR